MLKTHTHADTHTHNEISFSHKIKWKSCHVPCYKNSRKAAMSGCESKTPEGVCTETDGPMYFQCHVENGILQVQKLNILAPFCTETNIL